MRPGQKIYYQLLIDPARARLLNRIAEEQGLRPTALMRQFVYDGLYCSVQTQDYQAAFEEDAVTRQRSIKRQVEGRRRVEESTEEEPEELA